MREVKVRSSFTSRGFLAFGPWNDTSYLYSIAQINLGNNSNSRLEIVSSLNSFNYSESMWWYNEPYATQKYNPKVYSSAVQTVSPGWNFDRQNEQTNELPNLLGNAENSSQKSGSWPQKKEDFFLLLSVILNVSD